MFIDIPSDIIHIRKVSSDILSSLSSRGVAEDKLFDIRLCAEEAVRNAIVHGNQGNKRLRVKVACWVDGDKVFIEIEDEGEGYDPKSVPDPRGDNGIMKESGRGMFLIRKLMDKVDFNEKGNKIRMEKKLWP
ncbi:MAG: ATP-binding protein [Candidatus Omnitrophica bacterium]|nr:ATP-binding protein [Candidatus Omnitrophota bacterium]MDD5437245.1 ATP-binding protein [Candidatus Omnitrophota bacterium]